MTRVLIAGESWTTTSIHVKGFDSFTTVAYEEGVAALRDALLGAGHEVTFMPNHVAATDFPYAGDELKNYGNLVLVKHAGGYTTAYAHADRLVVARGDFVARGQVIGYSGQTGDVTSPQLHFEIRSATTPVNPRAYLSSNTASN